MEYKFKVRALLVGRLEFDLEVRRPGTSRC